MALNKISKLTNKTVFCRFRDGCCGSGGDSDTDVLGVLSNCGITTVDELSVSDASTHECVDELVA